MVEINKPDDANSYLFKVNGIEFESKEQVLLAGEILKRAAEQGAVPGKPEEYVLEGDKGRYERGDEVDLAEDSQFITVPDKPTPVA